MKFKFPVACVVGDCEGADKLCGRYGSHGLNVNLVCRDCNCPTERSNNPSVICHPITKQIILSAQASDSISQLSHHHLTNAFHTIDFGGDPQGIHGCTPPETLHLYQQGLYKYALEAFFGNLNIRQKQQFDKLVGSVSNSCKHQSDRSFPRFSFPHGVSNLTRITAEELTGVIVLCIVAIQSHCFGTVVATMYQKPRGLIPDPSLKIKCLAFAKLFEMMLSLESWIEKDTHSVHYVTNVVPAKIRMIMREYALIVNRTTGNQLKIPKFHQLLHIPRYILKFGSPNNFNSGRCESHHISLCKIPSKTAQKRVDCFEPQVGLRICDRIVTARAKRALNNEFDQVPRMPSSIGGTRFELVRSLTTGQVFIQCHPNIKDCWTSAFSPPLIQDIGDCLCSQFTSGRVPCFTEYRRGDNNQILFRAHPHYRSDSPWHDWANFVWATNDPFVSMEYPGKILFFCDLSLADNISGNYDTQIHAVIHSFNKPASPAGRSKFLLHGFLSNTLEVCDVDSIAGPAFVIPNMSLPNNYFVLPSRSVWADSFFFNG